MGTFLSLVIIIVLGFVIVKNVIAIVRKVKERKQQKLESTNKVKEIQVDVNDIQDVNKK